MLTFLTVGSILEAFHRITCIRIRLDDQLVHIVIMFNVATSWFIFIYKEPTLNCEVSFQDIGFYDCPPFSFLFIPFWMLSLCNASLSPFCQRLKNTLSRIFVDISLAFHMISKYPYSPILLYTSEKIPLPLSDTKYISIVFVSVLLKTSSLFTYSVLVFSTFFCRSAFLLHGVTYSSVRRLPGIYCHI